MGYREHLKKLFSEEKGNTINLDEKRKNKEHLIKWGHGFSEEYKIGMLTVGFQIIYFLLNKRKDVFCERFFLPEKKHQKEKVLTLETQSPLSEFDILSFSFSYELQYKNAIKILELSGIPIFSNERTEKHPLLIGGGICLTYNPEPLGNIFDVIVIGEAEEVIDDIVRVYKKWKNNGKKRGDLLKSLSEIKGVYIPSFYEPVFEGPLVKTFKPKIKGISEKVKRVWIENLDSSSSDFIVSKNTLWPNYYFLEIARGCGRHCRFCVLGYIFRRPRIKSFEEISRVAENIIKITNKIRFITPSDDDHPQINEILRKFNELGFEITTGSQRADLLTDKFVSRLNKQEVLTIAPETGSDWLRKSINKTLTNKDILKTVNYVIKYNIPKLQLYFIVGFPFERKSDIKAIADLSRKVRLKLDENGCEKTKLVLTINCHIRKPHTPFQWEEQELFNIYGKKISKIKFLLRGIKNTEINTMNKRQLLIEAILVRGDRRTGRVLFDAYKNGDTHQTWIEACKKNGVDYTFYSRKRNFDETLPWSIVDNNVSNKYLMEEFSKAFKLEYTTPCFRGCKRCGVCG